MFSSKSHFPSAFSLRCGLEAHCTEEEGGTTQVRDTPSMGKREDIALRSTALRQELKDTEVEWGQSQREQGLPGYIRDLLWASQGRAREREQEPVVMKG